MKLTEKDKSILIGLLLGDGYIDEKGRIYIEHGEKQKDYCIYKAKLLHSVCGGKDIKVHEVVKALTMFPMFALINKLQLLESDMEVILLYSVYAMLI